MSLVEVSATNYIVMSVGSCTPLEWDYQKEDTRGEYTQLYKVKGMPLLSKDTDNINASEELVGLSKEGREVEVIIDTPAKQNTIIMVQEVLNHGKTSVGTCQNVTPVKNDEGEATYTGVVVGEDRNGHPQIYTLMGDLGEFEMWIVQGGLEILLPDEEITAEDYVKLGGAIRFLAKDSDFIGEATPEGRRNIAHIDVINKYV